MVRDPLVPVARRKQKMILTGADSREEIQSLFDPHIDAMLAKVREQLDWTQVNTFGQQVVSRAKIS